jgi:hypothetical protein
MTWRGQGLKSRGVNSLRISLRPTTSFTGEDDIILVGRWLQKEAPL